MQIFSKLPCKSSVCIKHFQNYQDQKWPVDDRILQGQLSQTSILFKATHDFFKTTKTKFSKLQDQKWHVDDRILQQLSQLSRDLADLAKSAKSALISDLQLLANFC